MNKQRFFTLLNQAEIRPAPHTKIIPAAEFSILQQAQEVLSRIQKEAEHYRLEVAKESEKIKENAFKEGYDKGLEEWAEKLVYFEQQIHALEQEKQKMIIPVALKVAEKMVGRELSLSEDVIVDIVAASLKTVAQHKKITIYVNKKDLEIVEQHKPRLREIFEELESLSIRPRDDIAEGGCIIETEGGIVNAQKEHRWQIIVRAFDALIKKTTENLSPR